MQRKRTWVSLLIAVFAVVAAMLFLWSYAPAKTASGPPRGAWRVAEAVTYENLSVFPVVAAKGEMDTTGFATLDEALTAGDAVVTERGGEILRRSRDGRGGPIGLMLEQQAQVSASVNELVLVYRGRKPLLLLAGEVLTGGKQDRIIAKDRVVPPGAEPLPLNVFCVERGRWSVASAQFGAAQMLVHPSVRERAMVDKDQGEVWAAVRSGTTARSGGGGIAAAPTLSARELQTVVASEAPSESYRKIYKGQRVGQSVEAFAGEVERRFARAVAGLKDERVVGVVVAYGGELAWADVFASGELFDKYWPKLMRSYTVEALARPRTTERASLDDAREFLAPLKGHETMESEPGAYRWRQVLEGRYAEIELEALTPRPVLLHWVKIHRTS